MWSALSGCVDPGAEPPSCPCDEIDLPSSPVADEEGLQELLGSVRAAAFPGLEGVDVGVGPVDDLAFFRAWVELDTVALDDGRARRHTVQYDPLVLADPMPPAALAAVLAHELGHVEDYVAMDSAELLAFAGWYAGADPLGSEELAAYERQTDEVALAHGCADGLAAARDWIYAHSDPETLTEKERNYYTPAEIEAWSEVNGTCLP